MELKKEFIDSLGSLPGVKASALIASLDTSSPVSIRFNPFKISSKPEGDQVPWCNYGFYLDERPQFTLDPALHGGAYYVQEAGSMFIQHIMRSSFEQTEGLRVLDLCAAPGGKTTLLSTLVGLEGVVVANEVVRQRANVLADNAARWGLGNIVVTHNNPEAFDDFKDIFDAILIDAPCSGEGMMRKNDLARSEWSPQNVALCAARQRKIVAEAWRSLKPGGLLIYSTCTFNRAENEENVAWMVENMGAQAAGHIEIPKSWGIVCGGVECGEGDIETFRFYPHLTRAEGFFAAVMRKPQSSKLRSKMPATRGLVMADADRQSQRALGEWIEQPGFMNFARIGDNFYGYYSTQYGFIRQIAERLTVIHSGVPMGQLFHGKLRPDHSLALFSGLNYQNVPMTELGEQQAVEYLRKQDLDPQLFQEGTNAVCHNGLPIGWAKRIGHRVNNLYPKELRILMQQAEV